MSVGRIIAGKYCLLQKLGQGSMGSVWAAEHLALRSQVAVKLIQPQVRAVPNVLARFEREARALAKLRSPHVVQVLDYGVDSGDPYLVMELLHGETLRARLDALGRLDVPEVSAIAQQVARAMALSHAEGIVHRDLKPDNVFLTRDGDELVAKVLDFGISKSLLGEGTELTSAGTMLGTCHYMSPEQARGEAVDSRSDLWSLGVMVFECLTGQQPFHADSVLAAATAICTAPIVVPSQVSRVPVGFDEWFARAVCRDLTQRFGSAAELGEALRVVLGNREWVGTYAPPRQRPRPPGGKTERIDAFPSSESDRRGEVRVPSSIPAAIDGQREFPNTALVYNTSRSGALLTAQRSWELEQRLEIKLHLDSAVEGVLVSARVVRSSHRDDPFWKFEVAVQFDEPLSDELLGRIQQKSSRHHAEPAS